MSDQKARLVAECKRIEENCLYTATSHLTAAGLAGWAQGLGGAVPIVLGTVGGYKALSDPMVASPEKLQIAGVLTLVAGVVGSLMTYWDFAKSRLSHFSAGTKYKSLENQARRAWQLHAPDEEPAALKARVDDLAERFDALGEESELSGDISFLLARWKIGWGVYSTKADGNQA
jgi:hypothetical protein